MSKIKLTDDEKKKRNTERCREYNKKNTSYILININKNTDADIIKHLNNLNVPKSKYIRSLIRKDMLRYNEEGNGNG